MQISKQSAPPNELALAKVIEICVVYSYIFAVAEILLPNHTHATTVLTIYGCLWSPYGIGQTIIFFPCRLFYLLLFFLA